MKKLIVILFLSSKVLIAQNNQLKGIVTEQSSGNKPIANFTIKSSNSNTITSANDGSFILRFQNQYAGKEITIWAEKEGWEVVNEKELVTVIPSNYVIRPLKIIVCKKGTLAQNRIKYYNISVNYIQKRYEQEILKAKKDNKDWEKKVSQLEQDRDYLYRQAEELAERYSRVNFDDVSQIEKQAFDLYQDGKIKEAIALLESVDSESIIKKAKAEKQKWVENKNASESQNQKINTILKADSLFKN